VSRRHHNKATPSTTEIKLRADLDRARRELKRLKDAGPAHPDPARAGAADRQDEPGGDRAPDPAAGLAPDTGLEPEAPPPAAGVVDISTRLQQLERERDHLHRLQLTQVDEGRRRTGRLLEIVRALGPIGADLDPAAVLQRTAAAIQAILGFRIVLVRWREPGTHRLKAAAYAGLVASARAALEAEDVLLDDFQSWLKDEFRISRSYFISHKHSFNRVLPAGHVPELGRREDWEWHAEDVLLVPLHGHDGEVLGYVSVDDPADRMVPNRESIELLELLGHHAAVATENAHRYRRLEKRLQELEQAGQRDKEIHALKSHFVSTISHELRTPLTAIRAYLDTLMAADASAMGGDQLHRFLHVINDESQRLSRLIESVLDLSRFDAGNLPLRRQPLDLVELLEESLWLLRPMADAGQVNLKMVNELADTHMDADRDQLRQLVLHLGSNGVKFTPVGGHVEVRLKGDLDTVILEVEDTGIGIPPDALEKIFDRFYQVDSSLVRRYGGTGLGLAICKSIVEWHGGNVSATSTPERGSCFTVRLPRQGPRVVVRPGSIPQPQTEDVLRLALEMVSEVMNARVVSLMNREPGGDMVVQAAIGLDETVVNRARISPGQGVAGWVADNLRPVCVEADDDASEVRASGRPQYRTGSFVSVPLMGERGLLGVLNVTDPVGRTSFAPEDCNLLLDLADRMANALEQAQTLEATRAGIEDTTDALRRVLEHLRVSRTRAPDRVRLAQATARELNLSEAEVGVVGFAATVHDVGMTLVGRDIVAQPGSLSDEERRLMQRHVELGAELLRPLETIGAVRDVVMSHHEWWDGTGYPRGLRGADIPIGARVVAIVDAFESITRGRSHRSPQSRTAALNEIHRLAGRQFDPAVVEAFERALSMFGTPEATEGSVGGAVLGRTSVEQPAGSRESAPRDARR
jgi:signal transduction histidine kinase